MALGALLVAAVIGAVGFVVERTTSSVGGASTGVVSVTTTLLGGGIRSGAGMIIAPSGEVLTTYHVINGVLSIRLQLAASGASYPAAVTGIDPSDDLAVLQVQNASDLPVVTIGGSAHVAVGDHVTAIGAGSGGGPVETQGAVLALGQTVTASDSRGSNVRTLLGMIQTDAVINASDDGGPLVNGDGQVIGIETAATARTGAAQAASGAAYAIPIDTATAIAHAIESGTPNPKVFHGHGAFLGVDVEDRGSPSGAEVNAVEPGSPAQAVGISALDVIVAVNQMPIGSFSALQHAISAHHPGDRVTVAWLDPLGQRHSATLQLVTGFAA